METKAWGGRFSQPTDELVEHFTASILFDRRLYAYDIQGSVAHCRMLAKCGIITDDESSTIIHGLEDIKGEIERGAFEEQLVGDGEIGHRRLRGGVSWAMRPSKYGPKAQEAEGRA